jgi:hypothetical protein
MDDLAAFRAGLEAVFRNMDEQGLSDAARDRIRVAVEHTRKREPKETAPLLTGQLQGFHDRIVGYLEDADKEFPPEQVQDLEVLIREHLPNYP